MTEDASSRCKSIHETATQSIDCYTSAATKKDPTLLSATLSPTCKRYFGPKNILPTVGLDTSGLSNAEYENRMSAECSLLDSTSIEFQSRVVDERKRTVVTVMDHYLRMKGQEAEMCLEFIHVLDFNKSGEKVDNVFEFFDTAGALKFMEMMMSIAEEQQNHL